MTADQQNAPTWTWARPDTVPPLPDLWCIRCASPLTWSRPLLAQVCRACED